MPNLDVIDGNRVRQQPRILDRDFNHIADFIVNEWDERRQRRLPTEMDWKEIDRQVEMKPDADWKIDPRTGRVRKGWEWIPELELPLQAQTLEVLTADARRMQFPDSGTWYRPHSALTDEYLERADLTSLIAGDRNDIPTLIDQDATDQLVGGLLHHWHQQYDFLGTVDRINAEAFKYSMGVGRVRTVTKRVFLDTAKGIVRQEQRIPVLLFRSIRNVYPDDTKHRMANEGERVGTGTIAVWKQRYADLVLAANKGSKEPTDINGGWMPRQLKDVDEDSDHMVDVIEYEGDIVVPRKARDSLFIPNVIITCMRARSDQKEVSRVFRVRFNQGAEQSYIFFPYHNEDARSFYGSSPLMKGRPIQVAATLAFTRLLMAAALRAQPPIQYNKDDMTFAAGEGPAIFPGSSIGTTDPIEIVDVGDPTPLTNLYIALLQQYADVTGVNAPRLGAQTVSHTTAFAKDAEIQRGVARTVDYVRSSLSGGLAQFLDLEYKLGRPLMKDGTIYYVPAYGGFVEVDKSQLPDLVQFEVHGSGGPAEEIEKQNRRLQGLQFALQIDQLAVAQGQPPTLDLAAVQQQVLREAGWTDIDVIAPSQRAIEDDVGASGLAGAAGADTGAALPAAIQALAQAGG